MDIGELVDLSVVHAIEINANAQATPAGKSGSAASPGWTTIPIDAADAMAATAKRRLRDEVNITYPRPRRGRNLRPPTATPDARRRPLPIMNIRPQQR
jgi:hypothetical protein